MTRLLSGITPSGTLTIGNYIGAIKHFIRLQDNHEMYIFVANLHALTSEFDHAALAQKTRQVAALYLACGLDPAKTTLFIQSHVPAHATMAHILLCHTTLGELFRMTQFKDKGGKQNSSVRTGLLTYPTLMAADILLYDPQAVPVGADQKQHLELTRDIAIRMNNRYGELFTVPEPLIPTHGARIMSLTDPSKKMSKSDANPMSYVSLLDEPDVARNKIMKAVTDSQKGVSYDVKNRPGVSNLLTILAELQELPVKEVARRYDNSSIKALKTDLGDEVAAFLGRIREKYNEATNGRLLDRVLADGAQRAAKLADAKVRLVSERIGLV